MTRRMSCSLTVDAVRARTKVVTRRHVDTWKDLKPGDHLTLIEKGMGLPKGAHQVVLAEVEIVSVRVEPLLAFLADGAAEVQREGISGEMVVAPILFCQWWANSHGYGKPRRDDWRRVRPFDLSPIDCRRIEWRYLDA